MVRQMAVIESTYQPISELACVIYLAGTIGESMSLCCRLSIVVMDMSRCRTHRDSLAPLFVVSLFVTFSLSKRRTASRYINTSSKVCHQSSLSDSVMHSLFSFLFCRPPYSRCQTNTTRYNFYQNNYQFAVIILIHSLGIHSRLLSSLGLFCYLQRVPLFARRTNTWTSTPMTFLFPTWR